MKSIIVRRIEVATPTAENISTLLDSASVTRHSIASVNWKEYPYAPETTFRIAHNGTNILLSFDVKEKHTQAVHVNDGDNVWQDSCVEMFIRFAGNDYYYNIEANCIGTILLGRRVIRTEKFPQPDGITTKIQRWSSMGTAPLFEPLADATWQLSFVIPIDLFWENPMDSFSGVKATGNFYKCGDNLPEPHYVSWSPIGAEKPDFHLPAYFGELIFE